MQCLLLRSFPTAYYRRSRAFPYRCRGLAISTGYSASLLTIQHQVMRKAFHPIHYVTQSH